MRLSLRSRENEPSTAGEPSPKGIADGPILRVAVVNKTFHRGEEREHHVLKDVNLEVATGEVLVIIGPSGSGKSTLLRCINFLAPPDSGTVTFLGEMLSAGRLPLFGFSQRLERERRLRLVRQRMGMVFQHFNLFPHMTALENVAAAPIRVLGLDKAASRERARAELDRVGMGPKVDAYPSQLSGGQKQRVAIARALAMRPRLMLFDEVTSALDPELIGGILEEMKKLAQSGMTMVVVTHEMGFAREVGDRLIFMDAGEVIEQGPARQLLADPREARTRDFLRSIL